MRPRGARLAGGIQRKEMIMEAWERMWIENYTDLAADAKALGDEKTAADALENARFIAEQAEAES